MYTKVLLVVIILILSAFFYLHAQNPGSVTFVVTRDRVYEMPVALLVFFGFFAGVILAVLNSLLVDAKRAITEMRARKGRKLQLQAEDNYRRGVDALAKGDTVAARELIEKAVKAKPMDSGMITRLAETYSRENRPKDALKALENGYMNNPGSIDLLIAIERCSLEAGERFKAVKALEEVIAIDPKNPYALKKLRDFKVTESQWLEAAQLQKALIECEPNEAQKKKEKKLLSGLLFEAAFGYFSEGRLNESVSKIKEALKNDPAFMPAHMLLGEVLCRQGKVSNAIKLWEKARYRYQNPEPLLLKIEDLYIKESAPDKILEKYQKEIIAHPNDTNLRLLLSRLYLRLEMVDNAIEELERLQHEGGDAYYPHVLLGEAYLRRKQSGKAAHLFQKALGVDRDFLPPFVCTNCGHNWKTWSARCPSCGQWSTLVMKPITASKGHAPLKK